MRWRRLEVAERETTLQLQKAEAVAMAVRSARAELRRLAGAQRAAEAEAAAATAGAAAAKQVGPPPAVGRLAGDGWLRTGCLRGAHPQLWMAT